MKKDDIRKELRQLKKLRDPEGGTIAKRPFVDTEIKMTSKEELEHRVAEIDKSHADLMSERQDIVAQTHPATPEASQRIAEIDSTIIDLMNERGDCVEKAHSLYLRSKDLQQK